MRLYLFCCWLGLVSFQTLSELPPDLWYLLIVPALFALMHPLGRCLACFLIGFLWAMWRADIALATRLPLEDHGRIFDLRGTVISTATTSGGYRFDVSVSYLADLRGRQSRVRRLKLSWYSPDTQLRAGVECIVKVRLNVPYSNRNPGSFDTERWMLVGGFGARGYVVKHPENTCTKTESLHLLARVRRYISKAIDTTVGGSERAGVIRALAVAERDGLSPAQWDVLRDTGTAHLLAISGLHISFVASVAFVAACWLVGLCSVPSRGFPAQHPAAILAFLSAIAYAALAGFPVSTQRAVIMVSVVLLAIVMRRRALSLVSLLSAATLVAAWMPMTLLTAGYWLSFAAVATIVFVESFRSKASRFQPLWRVHIALALGLAPLLAILHVAVPSASPLANFIAVPVVTFFIVPLVLCGVVLYPVQDRIGAECWHVAASIWDSLWVFLTWLAQAIPPVDLPQAPAAFGVGLACLGLVMLAIPIIQGRYLFAGAGLAALVLPSVTQVSNAELRLCALDVGQGLAVVVETANHVLVYDTGPASKATSAAQRIVMPYLRFRGVREIDRLVLSHGDNDHASGWSDLDANITVHAVSLSPIHTTGQSAQRCLAGQHWTWDGVDFEFLHPHGGDVGSANNLSCVLQIRVADKTILLTGDIERDAEVLLVDRYGENLHAHMLVSPHHGSDTSSTAPFLENVRPPHVVHAAAFRNRYDFPSASVRHRYHAIGATQWQTGRDGAITVDITNNGLAVTPYRWAARRYWHLKTSARDEPDCKVNAPAQVAFPSQHSSAKVCAPANP